MTGQLSFGLLGPLSVQLDGEPLKLGGPKERLVLSALLLNSGRVVSTERLIDILWGEESPSRASGTLQVHVSNLRRRLAGGVPTVITQPPGYLLLASAEELDLLRFEELVALSREQSGQNPGHSLDLLQEALHLWRGPALADLDPVEFVESSRTFLAERRLAVEEARVNLMLALGRPQEALLLLSHSLEEHPLREPLWEQRMVALYRSGRQGEALASFRQCRQLLLDELGIEPSPRLRALEASILRQDPELDLVRAPETGRGPSLSSPELSATFVADGRSRALLVRQDGSTVALETVVILGRHPNCDVVLPDPAVSRQHAEIRPALGGHLLSDLASSNGTLVGDEPVMHRLLADGDVIRVGAHTLRYVRQ